MSTEQLSQSLQRFASAAASHDALQNPAAGAFAVEAVNAEAARIASAFKELAAYGNRGRDALLTLLKNPNKAVVAMAAVYSLRYATDAALAVLQQLTDEPGRIGLGAELSIINWSHGNWHLDEGELERC